MMEWVAKLAELGALAVVCVGLLYVNWKQGERYAKVIEDNTKAMTEVAVSNDALKDVLDKQGVMLTQQNFLFQQMCMMKKEGNS